MSLLLDAGPALNFLAVGQQNILIQMATAADLQLAAPERVDIEVEGVSKGPLFRRTKVLNTWRTLKSTRRLVILPLDVEDRLVAQAIQRVSGMSAQARLQQRKSLGEVMVIAQASVYAQQGQDVYVLIDERDGRRRATREIEHLQRTKAPGRMTLIHTLQVLHDADRNPAWILNGLTGEQVFTQMQRFDDGLRGLSYG